MSTRGYPVSDFEQRAADIFVDPPLFLRISGRATISSSVKRRAKPTEDLRQAMIHYRTLFEELVGEPELAPAQTAA